MGEVTHLDVFTILAAVAWADGVLAESEANVLVRAILSAELTADERREAGRLLDGPVALPDGFVTTLVPEARAELYLAACRIAVADKSLCESEQSMLVRLRAVLEISAETAEEIERQVAALRRT